MLADLDKDEAQEAAAAGAPENEAADAPAGTGAPVRAWKRREPKNVKSLVAILRDLRAVETTAHGGGSHRTFLDPDSGAEMWFLKADTQDPRHLAALHDRLEDFMTRYHAARSSAAGAAED